MTGEPENLDSHDFGFLGPVGTLICGLECTELLSKIQENQGNIS